MSTDLPVPGRALRTEPAMPAGPEATLQIANGIACIELDRPARGNALSARLVETLLVELGAACADPSVHTVALLAAGRHFCTGFDLSGLEDLSEGELLLRFVRVETLLDAVWRAPVRTVAIATGRAWGAGADLFAACDLRIATADASFRFPGAAFGIVLGTRRLAERVGTERARQWVTTGATLDACDAASAGLASRVASPADGNTPVDAWREALAGGPSVDRETLAAIRAASRPDPAAKPTTRHDADLDRRPKAQQHDLLSHCDRAATGVRRVRTDGLAATDGHHRQR